VSRGPANPVLDASLARLARYGYGAGGNADPAAEWARLAGDFADLDHPRVPDFAALALDAQIAARRYLALRRDADALLAACARAHRGMLADGLAEDRIEAYAALREAYEDKVEEFGAARAAVAALLAAAAPGARSHG